MGMDPGDNGYDIGTPCPGCWGALTPKRFLLSVEGVQICPGYDVEPNGLWLLYQDSPCIWIGEKDNLDCTYIANTLALPYQCDLRIFIFSDAYFWSGAMPICTLSFSNAINACNPFLGHCGYSGSAALFFGPGI